MRIMKSNSITSLSKHADFLLLDEIALVVAFSFAYFFKFGNFGFIESPSWRGLLLCLALGDLLFTILTNPYSGIFRRRYWEDVRIQLVLALESFLTACTLFYLLKMGEDFSREMIVVTYSVYTSLALLLKHAHKRRLLSRWNNRPQDSIKRIVLVCSSENAEESEQRLYADDMKVSRIVGFCFTDSPPVDIFLQRPAAPCTELLPLCSLTNADEVVILAQPSRMNYEVIENLMAEGYKVRIGLAESLGVSAETQEIGQIGIVKTLDLQRHSFGAAQTIYLPIKRAFDLLLGIAGCAITLPVAAIVKISYLVTGDTHPVFYKQTRIGLRGKPFQLWKLRSMVWNADEILAELLQDPKRYDEWRRSQKLDDDPRITPVGRLLRQTSLDELPQFFNVIMGDMSIIGPRPLVPGELEEHGGRPLYNKVKPGLTGWWACNGRSDIEYDERLDLEYFYVANCSLYLDTLCILRTALAVLKRSGAQ